MLSGFVREISYSYYESKFNQKRLLNIDDAEDLTQSVYLSFAEQYHNIEEIEKWLRRVLFLNFVKWYKTNKRKSTYQLRDNIPNPDNSVDSSTMVDADTILSVLNTMSEEKQEIVKLRFWGDLKFAEIAEKLNKNEAAVKKMFYRTLLDIKDKLK